jgi:hypothetical protein
VTNGWWKRIEPFELKNGSIMQNKARREAGFVYSNYQVDTTLLFFMAFPTLGRALGLLFVATLTPDVEGVLLGAGHGGIIGIGVLAVALEAAFDIIFSSGGVVTDYTIVWLWMGLVRKNHGWFFGLSFVDGNDIRRSALGDGDQGGQTDGHGQKDEHDNGFSFHMRPSLNFSPFNWSGNFGWPLSHTQPYLSKN